MKTILTITVSALAFPLAVVVLAGAGRAKAAPQLPVVLFGATHAQPVAGQPFTGLSVTPQGDTYIGPVSCNARLGHEKLHARVLRYHLTRGAKPVAVTCSWTIPADAGGRNLRVSSESITTTSGDTANGPPLVWRIRR